MPDIDGGRAGGDEAEEVVYDDEEDVSDFIVDENGQPIKRVHSKPDNDEPVFQCQECSCMFRKLGSLNAHMSREHSGQHVSSKRVWQLIRVTSRENIKYL